MARHYVPKPNGSQIGWPGGYCCCGSLTPTCCRYDVALIAEDGQVGRLHVNDQKIERILSRPINNSTQLLECCNAYTRFWFRNIPGRSFLYFRDKFVKERAFNPRRPNNGVCYGNKYYVCADDSYDVFENGELKYSLGQGQGANTLGIGNMYSYEKYLALYGVQSGAPTLWIFYWNENADNLELLGEFVKNSGFIQCWEEHPGLMAFGYESKIQLWQEGTLIFNDAVDWVNGTFEEASSGHLLFRINHTAPFGTRLFFESEEVTSFANSGFRIQTMVPDRRYWSKAPCHGVAFSFYDSSNVLSKIDIYVKDDLVRTLTGGDMSNVEFWLIDYEKRREYNQGSTTQGTETITFQETPVISSTFGQGPDDNSFTVQPYYDAVVQAMLFGVQDMVLRMEQKYKQQTGTNANGDPTYKYHPVLSVYRNGSLYREMVESWRGGETVPVLRKILKLADPPPNPNSSDPFFVFDKWELHFRGNVLKTFSNEATGLYFSNLNGHSVICYGSDPSTSELYFEGSKIMDVGQFPPTGPGFDWNSKYTVIVVENKRYFFYGPNQACCVGEESSGRGIFQLSTGEFLIIIVGEHETANSSMTVKVLHQGNLLVERKWNNAHSYHGYCGPGRMYVQDSDSTVIVTDEELGMMRFDGHFRRIG